MAAYKLLKALKASLKQVEDKDKQPGNWLGHWARSLKIKAIKHRINEIEHELELKHNKTDKNAYNTKL